MFIYHLYNLAIFHSYVEYMDCADDAWRPPQLRSACEAKWQAGEAPRVWRDLKLETFFVNIR